MSLTRAGSLVLQHGNIITMNPRQPRASALAVDQGRIVAVGAWDDVAPHAQGAPVLDLAGKTVLPGLIDTHAHLLWTALGLAAVDLSGANDHPSLEAIVRKEATGLPPDSLVFGMGFTEYALDTAAFSPIIDVLDAASPDHPVFLTGVTGHISAVNSRALEELDLPGTTPGVMRTGGGRPGGLLAGEANNVASFQFSQRFGASQGRARLVAQTVELAHSVGITTLHALEGGLSESDEDVLELLATIPGLPLRILLYYQTMDVPKVVGLGLPRIGGCILLDGDVGPHTAALSQPYLDDPRCHGTLYYTQETIDAFVLEAHRAGLQVAMHAVGDAAVEQALNAYEAALASVPRDDHRHRIEHCEVIREEQVQRAVSLDVALAIQPPFNHYWPHTHFYPTLGEERAWKADPVRTLVRAGGLVAGGSDSSVTPLGPMIGIHAAVNHSNPAERVSVQEALELYTINAARIGFTESDNGSLEVGKLGDLVVLGDDPFQVSQDHIKDIQVETTIIGGDIVYPS
jgi:predicted amidohydrolase YtcJ